MMSAVTQYRPVLLGFVFSVIFHVALMMQIALSDWFGYLRDGLRPHAADTLIEWVHDQVHEDTDAPVLADTPLQANGEAPAKRRFIGDVNTTAMDMTRGDPSDDEKPHLPMGRTEAQILPQIPPGRGVPDGRNRPVPEGGVDQTEQLAAMSELVKTLPMQEDAEPVSKLEEVSPSDDIMAGTTSVMIPEALLARKNRGVPDAILRDQSGRGIQTVIRHYSPYSNATSVGVITFGIRKEEYASYYKRVKNALNHYWTSFCLEAARSNLQGRQDRLEMTFVITPDGGTDKLDVLEHSRDPLVEKLWTRTIEESKIPPFPAYIEESFIQLGVRYYFNR